MAFTGWTAAAVDFYDGLEEDNSRSYWQAHKHVYEQAVRGPMEELLTELEGQFGPGRIYRPHRDLRFSPDKTPYKTAIGANLGDGGGYVQFSAGGLAAGRGMYLMATDQLDRYRRAVAADLPGEEIGRITAAMRQAGLKITAHDQLKTAPRGYPKDHPRIELLRFKGLIAWRQWPAGPWLSTPRARDRVIEFLTQAAPLQSWLDKHVGPSGLAPSSR
jgi:uncharacterized protein (TIGR02453 family)